MRYQDRKWLESLRERKGMTKKEVAKAVGITYSFYDNIEHGRKNAAGVVGLKISRVLGFDMALFYCDAVFDKKTVSQ